MNWQTIETAPKDERILVWCKAHGSDTVIWDAEEDAWVLPESSMWRFPTHWMPLPPAPGHDLSSVVVVDRKAMDEVKKWFRQSLRQWRLNYDKANFEDDLDLEESDHTEGEYYRKALLAMGSLASLNAGGEGHE